MRCRSMFPILLALFLMPGLAAQIPTNRPLRIIAFGAHPDDAELKFAGTAALFAAQGHKVKLVALTNGDVGHFAQAGGPLAQRRKAEVEACHAKLGVETDVLDIHDGELMPDLETRKKVAQPDPGMAGRYRPVAPPLGLSSGSPRGRETGRGRRRGGRRPVLRPVHAADDAQSDLPVLLRRFSEAVSLRSDSRRRLRRGRAEKVGLHRLHALPVRGRRLVAGAISSKTCRRTRPAAGRFSWKGSSSAAPTWRINTAICW